MEEEIYSQENSHKWMYISLTIIVLLIIAGIVIFWFINSNKSGEFNQQYKISPEGITINPNVYMDERYIPSSNVEKSIDIYNIKVIQSLKCKIDNKGDEQKLELCGKLYPDENSFTQKCTESEIEKIQNNYPEKLIEYDYTMSTQEVLILFSRVYNVDSITYSIDELDIPKSQVINVFCNENQ